VIKKQDKMLAKKRGRPATGRGTTIGVRCHDDLLAAIDAARDDEADAPSRPEMLRRVAVEALKRRGFMVK
jgi:hypothetical protein